MTLILDGKLVATQLQHDLKIFFADPKYRSSYLAICMLGDDHPGLVYVRLKHRFAQEIGLGCRIYGCRHLEGDGVDYDHHHLLDQIHKLNVDPDCIGIIIQQPLPSALQLYKAQILSAISPSKDCDGLAGILFGLDSIDRIDFIPATPGATINLLKYYNLTDFRGKTVAIVGQSNLIGKPLAMYCIKQGATVISINSKTPLDLSKKLCQESDYIFSATGVVHLINDSYTSARSDQVIVDIGRGLLDGKPVGDVNWQSCLGKCKALAKVPGGVGPVTVATLFDNIRILQLLGLELPLGYAG